MIELPTVGATVAEKYRLDAVIGQGGFAVVFRATDISVDREVAVKVLSPKDGTYDIGLASRFMREAKVLAGLRDPHTIQMFDFGRTPDGLLYLVFELLGGTDLSTLLAEHGPLEEAATVHVLRQVLQSLREAHVQGLLHRDIKPANIRVYEYMGDPLRAKLIDFGIARSFVDNQISLTRTGGVVGTLVYMAPEQAHARDLTPAADVFSLGLTVFEMLTGSVRGARQALADGHLPDIGASERLREILSRMLAPVPEARYPDAAAVLRALDEDEPARIPTPPPTPLPSENAPTAPLPGRPAQAEVESVVDWRAAVTAVVALALVVAGAAMWAARSSPDPPPDPGRLAHVLEMAPTRTSPKAPEPTRTRDAGEVVDTGKPFPGCGIAARPGESTWSTTVGLRRVEWLRYVPRGYDPDQAHPLLFLFYTDASSANGVMAHTKIRRLAKKHGVVVVAPEEGRLPDWPSLDAGAMAEILHQTASSLCIDPTRIYALGHGSGGEAAEVLACEPWIRAVASTSYRTSVRGFDCGANIPKPNLFFTPLKSRHVPVKGGQNCSNTRNVISLAEEERLWKKRNGCRGDPRIVLRDNESICYDWDCQTPFESCHIDGGHGWPHSPVRDIDVFGCDGAPADFPYLDTIWSFFESLPDE